jgi:hypothetical protein
MIKELRALLMEARDITQESLESNTTGFDEGEPPCECNGCERLRGLISRIDAVLMEGQ